MSLSNTTRAYSRDVVADDFVGGQIDIFHKLGTTTPVVEIWKFNDGNYEALLADDVLVLDEGSIRITTTPGTCRVYVV